MPASVSVMGEGVGTFVVETGSWGIAVGDTVGLGVFTTAAGVVVAFAETMGLTAGLPSRLGETLATGVGIGTKVAWSTPMEDPQADRAAMSGSETRSRTEDGEERMKEKLSITRKVLKYGDVRLGFLRGMIRVMQTGLVPSGHYRCGTVGEFRPYGSGTPLPTRRARLCGYCKMKVLYVNFLWYNRRIRVLHERGAVY